MKNENQDKVKQPNALLTFAGEQDAEALATAILAVVDKWNDENGGSREISVRAHNDRVIIGFKKEMDV